MCNLLHLGHANGTEDKTFVLNRFCLSALPPLSGIKVLVSDCTRDVFSVCTPFWITYTRLTSVWMGKRERTVCCLTSQSTRPTKRYYYIYSLDKSRIDYEFFVSHRQLDDWKTAAMCLVLETVLLSLLQRKCIFSMLDNEK